MQQADINLCHFIMFLCPCSLLFYGLQPRKWAELKWAATLITRTANESIGKKPLEGIALSNRLGRLSWSISALRNFELVTK